MIVTDAMAQDFADAYSATARLKESLQLLFDNVEDERNVVEEQRRMYALQAAQSIPVNTVEHLIDNAVEIENYLANINET